MNWDYLGIGICFLLVAYLIFKATKGKRASEKNNWNGLSGRVHIQGWGAIILCALVGLAFLLKSLPAQI